MKFEEANNIDTIWVMSLLGFNPEKTGSRHNTYQSPFLNEKQKTGSMEVWKDGGWIDYATEKKGKGPITLLIEKDGCNPVEALNKLRRMVGRGDVPMSVELTEPVVKTTQVVVDKDLDYTTKEGRMILGYLYGRGISARVAQKYCRLLEVNGYHSAGFKNDKGGWARRNGARVNSKGAVAPKGVTTICGVDKTRLNVFEGFIDFLSLLQYYKVERLKGDVVVLNSVSNIGMLLPALGKYETVNLFLDDDKVGSETVSKIQSVCSYAVDQRRMYKGYNDLNDWLTRDME